MKKMSHNLPAQPGKEVNSTICAAPLPGVWHSVGTRPSAKWKGRRKSLENQVLTAAPETKRRDRDSNPSGTFAPTGFRNRRLQPLSHLSVAYHARPRPSRSSQPPPLPPLCSPRTTSSREYKSRNTTGSRGRPGEKIASVGID